MTTKSNSCFTLDRGALARHLNVDGDDSRYGLATFGGTPGQQITQATRRAYTCEAITPAAGSLLHVIAADGNTVEITVCDQPPTQTQLRNRASAGLPCYRHVGDTRDSRNLHTSRPIGTFTGTCETIEQILDAANELLPALAALHLGEDRRMSLLAAPLRLLTYNYYGRLSTDTTGVSDLTEDDNAQILKLWPLLIEVLETGEAAEDWNGERQRTLLLRDGGATALAREMNAARARLVYLGAVAPGVMRNPAGGFARYLP